jgi:hypothetical protein
LDDFWSILDPKRALHNDSQTKCLVRLVTNILDVKSQTFQVRWASSSLIAPIVGVLLLEVVVSSLYHAVTDL